jgi:hypothetical protein
VTRRPRPLAPLAFTLALGSPAHPQETGPTAKGDAAPKLEHARNVEVSTQRGSHHALGSFFLVAGPRAMGLSELNQDLEANGYSTVGTRTTVGLAGSWLVRDGLILGVLIEGAPGSIEGHGVDGRVGYATAEMEAGWKLYRSETFLVHPFLGLGVSRLLVAAKTPGANAPPLHGTDLGDANGDYTFLKVLGTLDLGVSAQTFLPLSTAKEKSSGPAIGVQLGYSLTFAQSGWIDRDASSSPVTGPSGAVHGPYARLMLGYSWDRYDVVRHERTVEGWSGPSCELVCDPGYASCNGDRRDGCETVLGTAENCGGCGDSCSIENGSRECVAEGRSHVCGPRVCLAGFADCNGLLSDGCEVALATNPAHCGACDASCEPDERCESGACTR